MKVLFAVALAIGLTLSVLSLRAQTSQSAPPTATEQPVAALSDVPLNQQPTKDQVAKLFKLIGAREEFAARIKMSQAIMQQQVRQQVKEMTAKLPASTKVTPEQRAALDRFESRYVEKAMNLYPADEMVSDMAGIYQRHLTRDDVDTCIAFYSTPAGQHLLQLRPIILQEYTPLVIRRIQERRENLTAEMSKEFKDLINSSGSAPSAPAKIWPATPAPK